MTRAEVIKRLAEHFLNTEEGVQRYIERSYGPLPEGLLKYLRRLHLDDLLSEK